MAVTWSVLIGFWCFLCPEVALKRENALKPNLGGIFGFCASWSRQMGSFEVCRVASWPLEWACPLPDLLPSLPSMSRMTLGPWLMVCCESVAVSSDCSVAAAGVVLELV